MIGSSTGGRGRTRSAFVVVVAGGEAGAAASPAVSL